MAKTKSKSDGSGGRRKKCKKAFQLDRTANARESYDRKMQGRQKMKLNMLARQVDKKRQELIAFETSKPPTTTRLEKGNANPDKWVLRGPARPAALIARIQAGELDQHGNEIYVPTTTDLYNTHMGSFYENEHTRELLELVHSLAEESAVAGYSKQAIEHFSTCIKYDSADKLKARDGLVAALLDEGRAGDARALMENFNLEAGTVFAYSKLLTEFVSWAVMQEPDATEEVALEALAAAVASNPFIPVFICGYEIFLEVVECIDEIRSPPASGSVEECFLYCSKNIGVWMDTEGIRDWLAYHVGESYEEPVCVANDEATIKAGGGNDPMFVSMYETAVEMIKEDAADVLDDDDDTTDAEENEDPLLES